MEGRLTVRNVLQVSHGEAVRRPEAARRSACTMPRTLLLVTAAALPAMAGAFAPALPLGGQLLGVRSVAQPQVPTPQKGTTGSVSVGTSLIRNFNPPRTTIGP